MLYLSCTHSPPTHLKICSFLQNLGKRSPINQKSIAHDKSSIMPCSRSLQKGAMPTKQRASWGAVTDWERTGRTFASTVHLLVNHYQVLTMRWKSRLNARTHTHIYINNSWTGRYNWHWNCTIFAAWFLRHADLRLQATHAPLWSPVPYHNRYLVWWNHSVANVLFLFYPSKKLLQCCIPLCWINAMLHSCGKIWISFRRLSTIPLMAWCSWERRV